MRWAPADRFEWMRPAIDTTSSLTSVGARLPYFSMKLVMEMDLFSGIRKDDETDSSEQTYTVEAWYFPTPIGTSSSAWNNDEVVLLHVHLQLRKSPNATASAFRDRRHNTVVAYRYVGYVDWTHYDSTIHVKFVRIWCFVGILQICNFLWTQFEIFAWINLFLIFFSRFSTWISACCRCCLFFRSLITHNANAAHWQQVSEIISIFSFVHNKLILNQDRHNTYNFFATVSSIESQTGIIQAKTSTPQTFSSAFFAALAWRFCSDLLNPPAATAALTVPPAFFFCAFSAPAGGGASSPTSSLYLYFQGVQ